MNQSAAFKDFFLIPWPRIRYLAWNILRAILRLFLSFPLILSFPPSPFSISSPPFNVQGMVCLLATRWEKEKERKGREGRKPLEIGNAEKTVGLLRCRVRSCSRVDPARVGIKRGKGVYLTVVIFVPGLLLEIFFFSSFGIWKDLIEDRSEIEGIGNLVLLERVFFDHFLSEWQKNQNGTKSTGIGV